MNAVELAASPANAPLTVVLPTDVHFIVTNYVVKPFKLIYHQLTAYYRHTSSASVHAVYGSMDRWNSHEKQGLSLAPQSKRPEGWIDFVNADGDKLYPWTPGMTSLTFDNLVLYTQDHTQTPYTPGVNHSQLNGKSSHTYNYTTSIHADDVKARGIVWETAEAMSNGLVTIFYGTGDVLTVQNWQPSVTHGSVDVNWHLTPFNPAVLVAGHGNVLNFNVRHSNDGTSYNQQAHEYARGLLATGYGKVPGALTTALKMWAPAEAATIAVNLLTWVAALVNEAGAPASISNASDALSGLVGTTGSESGTVNVEQVESLSDNEFTTGWRKCYVTGSPFTVDKDVINEDPRPGYVGDWAVDRYKVSTQSVTNIYSGESEDIFYSLDTAWAWVRTGKTLSTLADGTPIEGTMNVPLPVTEATAVGSDVMWMEYTVDPDGLTTKYRPVAYLSGAWTPLTEYSGGTWQ
jgi:hypothetical protein